MVFAVHHQTPDVETAPQPSPKSNRTQASATESLVARTPPQPSKVLATGWHSVGQSCVAFVKELQMQVAGWLALALAPAALRLADV